MIDLPNKTVHAAYALPAALHVQAALFFLISACLYLALASKGQRRVLPAPFWAPAPKPKRHRGVTVVFMMAASVAASVSASVSASASTRLLGFGF